MFAQPILSIAILLSKPKSRTWQAFYRTAIRGDAPADVAADLGISVWAVYKARSRVLQKLKDEYAGILS